MNYDRMSVHELILDIANQGYTGNYEPLSTLESALRKAVIREASVGVGTVRREGKAPLEGAPEMDVSCETKDGDYDIVPKETP